MGVSAQRFEVGENSPDCAHCGLPERVGYSVVKGRYLCHTDEGLDCYRLVTVYGHLMPCMSCIAKRQRIQEELDNLR